jgi:circadian clock protein KaiB
MREKTSRRWIMKQYILKLYVTGKTPRSQMAITNLKTICEREMKGEYEIIVIDVLEQPELAEQDKILATPTLIKQLPVPIRRIIGDISKTEKVLLGLDLIPKNAVDGEDKNHV